MEAVGFVLMLPCSIGIVTSIVGWLLKCPYLKWIGLAVSVIAWATMTIVTFFDGYENRKEQIIETLQVFAIYPVGSVVVLFYSVILIPVLAAYGIWELLLWLRRKIAVVL